MIKTKDMNTKELHEKSLSILEMIEQIENRVELSQESIINLKGHFPKLAEKYQKEIEHAAKVKARLLKMYDNVLAEIFNHKNV